MVWGVSPTLPALIWVLQEGDTRTGLDKQGFMWGSAQRPVKKMEREPGKARRVSCQTIVL